MDQGSRAIHSMHLKKNELYCQVLYKNLKGDKNNIFLMIIEY